MPKKLTMDEITNKIVDKHGDELVVTKYSTNTHSQDSEFKCNICGHVWTTSLHSVIRGTGCKVCGFKKSADKNKNTIVYIRKYIEDRGCILKDNAYINNETPISILFECVHIHSIRFGSFERGKRCPECGKKRSANISRLTIEEIVCRIESQDLIFIDFPNEYENNQSEVRYVCKKGHMNRVTVMGFTAHPGCRKCNLEKMAKSRTGEKHHLWKGTQKLKTFLAKQIGEWKLLTMKNCSYGCFFTGNKDFQIHHLHNFSSIIDEALESLNLQKKMKNGDYTTEELGLIVEKVQDLHKLYPGVCLRKDIHKLYHKIYSTRNNSLEQFEEFKNKIEKNEIII
jgi:hypothetical protein